MAQLHLVGASNESYAIQYADDLTAPNPWSTFITGTTDGLGAFSTTNTPPAGTTKRFYRGVRVSRALQATTTSATGVMNTSTPITLAGTDILNPNARVTPTVLTLPARGSLQQWDGTAITAANTQVTDVSNRVHFVPPAGDRGNPYTSFTYRVSEPGTRNNPSQPATVAVAVVGPPTPTTSAPQTNENTPVRFQFTAIDPEYPGSTAFSFIVVSLASNGYLYQVNADNTTAGPVILSTNTAVTNASGYLIYAPSTNTYGSGDALTYQAISGVSGLKSDLTTLSLNVAHVNQPPTATAASYTGTNNVTSFPLTLNCSDPDDPTGSLTTFFTTLPSVGSLTLQDGTPVVAGQSYSTQNFVYQHTLFDIGNPYATFSFYVRDPGGLASATVTDTLIVTYANGPPVSTTPTSVTLAQGSSAMIEVSGTDPDNDSLRYFITRVPTHGKLYYTTGGTTYDLGQYPLPIEITNANLTGYPSVNYVPDANYNNNNQRPDNFGYRVQDVPSTHPGGGNTPAAVVGSVALIVTSSP